MLALVGRVHIVHLGWFSVQDVRFILVPRVVDPNVMCRRRADKRCGSRKSDCSPTCFRLHTFTRWWRTFEERGAESYSSGPAET